MDILNEIHIEGKPTLLVPDTERFVYYDGWFVFGQEGGPFGTDNKYDTVFASVAIADWRSLCKNQTNVCNCTCTYCILARGWQELFNELVGRKLKL